MKSNRYMSEYPLLENKRYIYILIDPLDFLVRYVGITNYPVRRFNGHFNPKKWHKNAKANWVRQLKDKNLRPIMQIIMICPENEAEYWEAFFYEVHQSEKILNVELPEKHKIPVVL